MKKKCCKNPKNWKDYAVMGNFNDMGSTVSYRCIKCKKEYGMDYMKYLKIMRETYPNKYIPA